MRGKGSLFRGVVISLPVLFIFGTAGVPAAANDSVYTDLRKCERLESPKSRVSSDEEEGGAVTTCPGVGGYRLLSLEDDNRVSVTVVAPDGKRFPLNFWRVVTPVFSSLGDKAEWRVVKQDGKTIPKAVIVRVLTHPDPSVSSEKPTSYLAVTKITPKEVCVTEKVKAGERANERAREAADVSETVSCIIETDRNATAH